MGMYKKRPKAVSQNKGWIGNTKRTNEALSKVWRLGESGEDKIRKIEKKIVMSEHNVSGSSVCVCVCGFQFYSTFPNMRESEKYW